MRSVALACIATLLAFCSSGSTTGLLYERKSVDRETAVAQAGQPVYAKVRVGSGAGRAKVIYSHYIFLGATQNELLFSYEEHYDRIKEQADLKEPKSIPYPNGEAFLEEMKLVLYRVTPTLVEYKLEAVK